MRVLFLGMAAALAVGVGQAMASEARMLTPVEKPMVHVLDGRVWSCAGDTCTARGKGDGQPARRECARIRRVIGPIVAYSRDGAALDADQLAACNGGSIPTPVQALRQGEDRDVQHQQREQAAGQPARLAGAGAP